MASVHIMLSAIAWFAAAPIILIYLIFLSELLAGVLSESAERLSDEVPGTTAILIPAHNEEAGIACTLLQLLSTLQAGSRILVIADNCTDATAAISRQQGAEVIERHCPDLRGKGYALAFGRDALFNNPPDCVIVLDADCCFEPGSAERLIQMALQHNTPVQACNLVRSEDPTPLVEISNFAMLIKNLVRQRGMVRLGGAALLTGTGMALPWSIFKTAPLHSGDLAEDLQLTVALTCHGHVPRFIPDAQVWSSSALREDTLTQRARWEQGFMTVAVRHAMPLILSGIIARSKAPLLLGLHLCVPPLALLFTLTAAVLFLDTILAIAGASPLPLALLAAHAAGSSALIIYAWHREGRLLLSPGTLLRIPAYIIWKIPFYLKLAGNSEKKWVRTRRPDDLT